MKNRWKKTGFLWMLVFLLSAPVPAAAEEFGNVFDDAGLLTETQRAELDAKVTGLKEKTGWDVFAVTTADAQGKSAMEYADDFYDARTAEESDGILALIDMDNREIYLSTCGEAIRYLTDGRIDTILDDAFGYVSEGDYSGCLAAMLRGAEYCYEKGIVQGQSNYDVETGAVSEYRSLTWEEAVPVLLAAIVSGAAIYFFVARNYSIRGGSYDYPYMKYGKVDLTEQEDRFLHESVTHYRIQTDSGNSSRSSGRSSTHSSSSGRSHGGGGRKF